LAAREVARDERFEPSATAEATKSTCKSAACIVDASAPESRRRAPYHYARAKAWSYDVFVAHASEDKAVARELVRAIEARGLSVWFDEEELLPGDSLRRRISAAPSAIAKISDITLRPALPAPGNLGRSRTNRCADSSIPSRAASVAKSISPASETTRSSSNSTRTPSGPTGPSSCTTKVTS
jgi:hypothetical protein